MLYIVIDYQYFKSQNVNFDNRIKINKHLMLLCSI